MNIKNYISNSITDIEKIINKKLKNTRGAVDTSGHIFEEFQTYFNNTEYTILINILRNENYDNINHQNITVIKIHKENGILSNSFNSFNELKIYLVNEFNIWSKEDSMNAINEGWNLYDTKGSIDGNIQVQKNDNQNILQSDEEAWVIIKSQSLTHHSKALKILQKENIKEYNRIMNVDESTKELQRKL